MTIEALIFDVDGTLTDTNEPHVVAWQKAFSECGYQVSREQILPEIGKGGDFLVKDVLGAAADEKDGTALRKAHTQHFIELMKAGPTNLLPGARELIEHARRAGLRLALATSSKTEEIEAVERSTGVKLRDLFDVVATSSDAEQSKPAPDLVKVALQKLELAPAACVFVGDTLYDAQACAKAGVPMLGVRSGPSEVSSHDALSEAGARATYQNAADLLAHFDAALQLAGAAQ